MSKSGRDENSKATPQIDTLFKVLHPLGFTIEIVPLVGKQSNVSLG